MSLQFCPGVKGDPSEGQPQAFQSFPAWPSYLTSAFSGSSQHSMDVMYPGALSCHQNCQIHALGPGSRTWQGHCHIIALQS